MSIVFVDTKVWTEDGLCDWLLIENGIVKAVGCGDAPVAERVVSLGQTQYILPGLIDAHIHMEMLGEQLMKVRNPGSFVDLKSCSSLESLAEAVKASSAQNWIIGGGWDQDRMGLDVPFTRADLEALVPMSVPIVLYRNCYHLCVCNSVMLMFLGLLPLDERFPDNLKPYLELPHRLHVAEKLRQMASTGKLVNIEFGVLKETSLFYLRSLFHGLQSKETIEEHFKLAEERCLSNGITAVQTNDFYNAWSVYSKLVDKNQLNIRTFLTVPLDEVIEGTLADESEFLPLSNDTKGLLSCHRVKVFADGSLGARTAALRQPYADCHCKHDCLGILIQTKQELIEKFKFANELGYRLEIHVIGDLATKEVLDALEACNIAKEDRPILTHCQVLGRDLIDRMAKLGVIADVQPSFVTTDAAWCTERLGKDSERLKCSYAWKTLIDNGIVVAGSSDAPVEEPNPFLGMHAAMFRTFDLQKPNGTSSVFLPEERLTFKEAIRMYTTSASYTAGEEDTIGQLKSSYKADFVIIDQPIWLSDFNSQETYDLLLKVKVQQVWVDGKRRL